MGWNGMGSRVAYFNMHHVGGGLPASYLIPPAGLIIKVGTLVCAAWPWFGSLIYTACDTHVVKVQSRVAGLFFNAVQPS